MPADFNLKRPLASACNSETWLLVISDDLITGCRFQEIGLFYLMLWIFDNFDFVKKTESENRAYQECLGNDSSQTTTEICNVCCVCKSFQCPRIVWKGHYLKRTKKNIGNIKDNIRVVSKFFDWRLKGGNWNGKVFQRNRLRNQLCALLMLFPLNFLRRKT